MPRAAAGGAARRRSARCRARSSTAAWADRLQRSRALDGLVADGLVDPLPDGRFALPGTQFWSGGDGPSWTRQFPPWRRPLDPPPFPSVATTPPPPLRAEHRLGEYARRRPGACAPYSEGLHALSGGPGGAAAQRSRYLVLVSRSLLRRRGRPALDRGTAADLLGHASPAPRPAWARP